MKTPSTGPGKRRRRRGCSVRANSANSTAPSSPRVSGKNPEGPLRTAGSLGRTPPHTHTGPMWISFERTSLQETVLAQPRRELSLIYTPDHTAGLGQALSASTQRGLTGAPQPSPSAGGPRERRAHASGPTIASGAASRLLGCGTVSGSPREPEPSQSFPTALGQVGEHVGRGRQGDCGLGMGLFFF